ncbi:MAG: cytochrome B [Ignavibacteriae bacterium]|nr:MAG: cytochrome B [Ignavibacteriota bacterium]
MIKKNKRAMRRLEFLFILLTLTIFTPVMVRTQTVDDCLACHEDKTLSTERHGKTVSLYVDRVVQLKSPHAKLICTACHTGFDPGNIPHKEKINPVNCLTCHANAVNRHEFHAPVLKAKGDGAALIAACKQCHGTHDVVAVKANGSNHPGVNLVETCGACHTRVKQTFVQSAHAKALAAGVIGAPDCITCHRHPISKISEGADTAQFKRAQEKICLSCHLDDPNVKARTSPTAGFIASYDASVHGSAISRGNGKAANCVDCHGSHDMNKGSNPASRVNKQNIAQTCGTCHADIARAFKSSIHGTALQKGITAAPTCTDCHGEHNILKHTDPKSPVASTNVSSQVCSPCHSSVKLSQKFGFTSDRYQSYADSYHGLAGKHGSVEVANCASCHGIHDIKLSSDSTSRVSKANLAKTCGKCHPGANENFAKGSVHVIAEQRQEDLLYFVTTGYIVLIIVVIGGMIVHNLLDFVKKSKRQLMFRRGLIERVHPGHRLYVRMTLEERIQHGTLLISFLTLVLTGFALRFPDAWWVAGFRQISPVMFELRGILHRIAAVILVAASLYHLYYILFTEQGKKLVRDLLPVWMDVTDAIGVMKYNLGISKEKPRFARFSYIEKSEYWALVWGTMVMAATGVILWFDNTFLGLLTKLWWDVARTVHYYEAWLATLAIIVWHFYFIIFNPDIYPLNLAFWKGTLTEEEMEEEHPLELEEIKRKEMKYTEIGEEPSSVVFKEE